MRRSERRRLDKPRRSRPSSCGVVSGPSAIELEPRFGPFLWGARNDLIVFLGSGVAALTLGLLASRAGIKEVSDFGWLLLVLGVDVAHVHATWFRTYFDIAELRRHPFRYALLPALAYVTLVLLYRAGPLQFWRGVAYLAVFHFVRQQVGWVALYRAAERRARGAAAPRWERWLDDAAVYAATLYPLLVWHAAPVKKPFAWFMSGDFLTLPLAPYLPLLRWVWLLLLAAFFAREAWRWLGARQVRLGKAVVVAVTALTWYVGVVGAESDFVFTANNVIPHGVPYAYLLYRYTRARAAERRNWSMGELAAAGFAPFVALLIGFAFIEEVGWDRLVDHDRSWLFGAGPTLAAPWLALVVPLLALPQVTHYLLDGLLWRRGESRALSAQRAAVGLDEARVAGGPSPGDAVSSACSVPGGSR